MHAKPGFGVYVNEPSELKASVPFAVTDKRARRVTLLSVLRYQAQILPLWAVMIAGVYFRSPRPLLALLLLSQLFLAPFVVYLFHGFRPVAMKSLAEQ